MLRSEITLKLGLLQPKTEILSFIIRLAALYKVRISKWVPVSGFLSTTFIAEFEGEDESVKLMVDGIEQLMKKLA